jgi:hypothetical protein
MNWPVTRDRDGKTGVVLLSQDEIVKFTTQGNRILIHTLNDIFYHVDSLDKIETALRAAGLPYERADRGNLIDITKVIEIDEKTAIAYFGSEMSGGKRIEATISRPENYRRILAKFLSLKDKKE